MIRLISILLVTVLATKAYSAPIMIFMGGFGSCSVNGDTAELKFNPMIDSLLDQANQAFNDDIIEIRTCYAVGSTRIFVSSEKLGLDSFEMTRDSLSQKIAKIAAAKDDSPVYVWGQSHGGWTAMDLVRRLPNLNYRVLTTVDPISVENCGPGVFMGGVITGYAPGCREAPTDLEPDYKQIAKSVPHWINWYQLEFSLLHSGEISNANENIERTFDASWWLATGAHGLTDTDPVMWEQTTTTVVSDLKTLADKHR